MILPMAKKRSLEYILAAAAEIAKTTAFEANAISYIPRFMANVSLPVRKVLGNEYSRRNGRYTLYLISPSEIGLPYGSYPRQLIIHITTQAKIKGCKEINLGSSQSSLLRSMGIQSSGGKNGTSNYFREQTKKLLASSILWCSSDDVSWDVESIRISNSATLTWSPTEQTKWEASLILDDAFFQDVINNAVPIDQRVINACSYYPMAIDLYCWLTYRYYRMPKPQLITWEQLANQFGNNYARKIHFKNKFIQAIERISLFYPAAKISILDEGVLLYPSPPHVSMKLAKKLHFPVENTVDNKNYPRIKGDDFTHIRWQNNA